MEKDIAAAEKESVLVHPEPEIDPDGRRVSAPVRDRVAALTDAVRTLDARGIAVEDIALRRPTLDEVFLRMTETETVA